MFYKLVRIYIHWFLPFWFTHTSYSHTHGAQPKQLRRRRCQSLFSLAEKRKGEKGMGRSSHGCRNVRRPAYIKEREGRGKRNLAKGFPERQAVVRQYVPSRGKGFASSPSIPFYRFVSLLSLFFFLFLWQLTGYLAISYFERWNIWWVILTLGNMWTLATVRLPSLDTCSARVNGILLNFAIY